MGRSDRAPPAARADGAVPDASQSIAPELRRVLADPDRADVDGVLHSTYNDRAMSKRPQAKTVKEVCTLCGLDWQLHGDAPTSDKCVELLLDEIRSLNAQLAVRPLVQAIPWAYPPPVFPRPWPYQQMTSAVGVGGNWMASTNQSVSVPISRTPAIRAL